MKDGEKNDEVIKEIYERWKSIIKVKNNNKWK